MERFLRKALNNFDVERERVELWDFHRRTRGSVVGVVCGTLSKEDQFYARIVPREKLGVTSLVACLLELGYDAKDINPAKSGFLDVLEKIDYAILNLHGEFGEDGRIQGLLDFLGKRYSGSGVQASAIGINKGIFKTLVKGASIRTPDFRILRKSDQWDSVKSLGFPLILKPMLGGSSIGTAVAKSAEDVRSFSAGEIFAQYKPYLAEEFIKGKSVTIAIIETETHCFASPTLEICTHAEFYDEGLKAGYGQDTSTYKIPANLSPELIGSIESIAFVVHNLIGCSGFSRVDFLVTDNEPFILEINTTPGFSKNGNFAAALRAMGLTYEEMTLALLRTCAFPKDP